MGVLAAQAAFYLTILLADARRMGIWCRDGRIVVRGRSPPIRLSFVDWRGFGFGRTLVLTMLQIYREL